MAPALIVITGWAWLSLLAAGVSSSVQAIFIAASGPTTTAPTTTTPSPPEAPLAWLDDVETACVMAQRKAQPILVVFGAQANPASRQLERSLDSAEVRAKLTSWICVRVDAGRSPEVAASLQVERVPAMRALTPVGRLAAGRDGVLDGQALLAWLDAQHPVALAAVDNDLLGEEGVDEAAVQRIVKHLSSADPIRRSAAIRRLLPSASVAAGAVTGAFANGNLGTRLAAFELLEAWGAPVDGLDPWTPQTITETRANALRQWSLAPKAPATAATALSAEQLASAKTDLNRLIEASTFAEAMAIRERLVRWGPGILPDVRARELEAASDRVRQRLTALRYRLVASDSLAFGWLGGIERLSSGDVQVKRQAAQELGNRATARESALLLELFSDSDPLVRELSLRALQRIGGATAVESLMTLLRDPEPNVRAAVLKLLAEQPVPGMVPKIAAYVASEKDPDLVVHAVRVLRAAKGQGSIACLQSLLAHANWQVRAEAAEALNECASSLSDDQKVDVYAMMVKLLDDSDGFVVSRAVAGLQAADLKAALEPMMRAAEKWPDLAPEAIKALSSGRNTSQAAMPYLRKFRTHANARVRAAAIAGLCSIASADVSEDVCAALQDADGTVRLAAAEALFSQMERLRPTSEQFQQPASGSWIVSLFTGGGAAALGPGPWLDQFRAGKGARPKWMDQTIPFSEKMLAAESPAERLAAALPLIGMGQDAKALPVLLAVAKSQPALLGRAAEALPWVPWESRLELFRTLSGIAASSDQLSIIVRAMSIQRDERAAAVVWEILGRKEATVELAGRLLDNLRTLYLGERYYDPNSIPAADRKRLLTDARDRATKGSDLQRSVAMALLLCVSLEDSAEVAAQLQADPASGEWLRLDALQVQLLSLPRPRATQLAVSALTGHETAMRKVALPYLAGASDRLHYLRATIYLGYSSLLNEVRSSDEQFAPLELPKGLTADHLKPLLAAGEPETIAYAGYLLALSQDRAGLNALIKHWREKAHNDDSWKRLVYRGVAAVGDDSLTPVLEEIYKTYSNEDYRMREFYWTIRTMDGPNILKLRKQIRQDVGMERLR